VLIKSRLPWGSSSIDPSSWMTFMCKPARTWINPSRTNFNIHCGVFYDATDVWKDFFFSLFLISVICYEDTNFWLQIFWPKNIWPNVGKSSKHSCVHCYGWMLSVCFLWITGSLSFQGKEIRCFSFMCNWDVYISGRKSIAHSTGLVW